MTATDPERTVEHRVVQRQVLEWSCLPEHLPTDINSACAVIGSQVGVGRQLADYLLCGLKLHRTAALSSDGREFPTQSCPSRQGG